MVEAAVDSVAGAETTAAVVDLAGLAGGVLVAAGLVGIGELFSHFRFPTRAR